MAVLTGVFTALYEKCKIEFLATDIQVNDGRTVTIIGQVLCA